MNRAARILTEAQQTGRVWIEGEFEFPYGITCGEAQHKLATIAEACGGCVTNGRSQFNVFLPGVGGFFTLDWYDGSRPGPWRIDHYTCETASADLVRNPDGTLTKGKVS